MSGYSCWRSEPDNGFKIVGGVDVALCEFFMVEAFGQRFVCLFFSQLDAELMRIGENGHGNRYELMESSAAELRFFMRELKHLHCALILGFAGREDGRLYRNPAGRWSTCPMPLLPGDEAWLFRGGAKPKPGIVTDAERIYPGAGLGSYLTEYEKSCILTKLLAIIRIRA